MKNLIDCGSNLGQGFEHLKSILNIDDTWRIFMFEPNPNCYNHLVEKYNLNTNVTIQNKAVHASNEEVKLFIPKNDEFSVSSTIYNEFHNSKYNQVWDNFINVTSTDLIDLINSFSENDEVFLKMDIEGSEYEILEKLIEKNILTRFTKIFVEFHNQYISDSMIEKHNLNFRKQNILNYLEKNKISYELWY
jgi:FkbM family methyltransferase